MRWKMKRRELSVWAWLWLWFFAATAGSPPSGIRTPVTTEQPSSIVSTSMSEISSAIGMITPSPRTSATTTIVPGSSPAGSLHDFHFTRAQYNVSIAENSLGKTYALPEEKMGIGLSNLDRDVEIKYRIVGGDKFFKAEERTVGDFCFLLIRTRTGNVDVLNRERKDRYVLEVRATGTRRAARNKLVVLDAEATVIVTVLDTNDLNPLFYPTEYKETVTEDTPLHRSILRVSAEDADLGRNGEIYYSFAEETDQFAVHPVSGVITLTRPLRYAEGPLYELTVLAEDRGALFRRAGTIRASTARVTIRVRQVNLYAPEIYVNHLPEILENSNADIYAIVRVLDRDEGVHGQIASLDIVGGDPDGHFRVRPGSQQPGEYNIEVLHLLDREKARQGYNLSLRAVDRGTPQRFSHKTVPVHLADMNDNAPVFSREIYDVRVPETAPVNTPVIKLKVTDADEGKNALVSLEIVGGNEGGEFHVNANTGMLYTAVPLDAEKKALYTLTVSAVDQGNAGTRKQSSAKVKINVIDTNDNDPTFEQTEQLVWLDENEPAGTAVVKVTAKDRDSGENAYISYSIDNIEKVPFDIDPFTGIVKTKQVLNYETMKRDYLLAIRASDWGLPYRRQTEMQLRIKLRDVNDNRPQFQKIDCNGHVARHLPIGSEIITVSAIDFDAGNTISYRIVSGNEDNCFSLDASSGVLSVACDLTDVKVAERIVNVTATDGTHFADVNTVRIHLVNAKRNVGSKGRISKDEGGDGGFECRDSGVARRLVDANAEAEKNNAPSRDDEYSLTPRRYGGNVHAPEYVDFPNEIRVNESATIGTNLVTIRARDRDLDYNGKLVYGISGGDEDSVFGIDLESGDVTVIGHLDREKESQYFLNVSVYDLGKPQKSASRMLPITILDVNDNAPKFEKPLASFKISENALNGTIVFRANASDADLGDNAKIEYSLVTETRDFKVDTVTGVLSVFGKLDRERQEVYELKIRARDNGGRGTETPPLYSDALVRVTVDDVNDNPPKFALTSYTVKTREDVPVWSVIAVVEAIDPDEGPGGEVEYFLSDLMESEAYFKVDRVSGTIRTAQHLDFEERQVHTLTIVAKDRGEPSLTSETMVIVEVVDVNENLHAPIFEDFVISASVLENQPIGTLVTTVRAKDMDPPGGDSRIGYSIRGGDGVGIFSIDDEEAANCEGPLSYLFMTVRQDTNATALIERLHTSERIRKMSQARVVTPRAELPGEALIGESCLYFVPDNPDMPLHTDYIALGGLDLAMAGGTAWRLEDIRELHRRRYQLQERAIEIFLVTGRTYLLAFNSSKERDEFATDLSACNLPRRVPGDDLGEALALWRSGALTNWEYITCLNKLAGRSYNDLMQYPVFPFVLSDYTNDKIDLNNPKIYRNFERPMAVQDKKNEQHYVNNYNMSGSLNALQKTKMSLQNSWKVFARFGGANTGASDYTKNLQIVLSKEWMELVKKVTFAQIDNMRMFSAARGLREKSKEDDASRTVERAASTEKAVIVTAPEHETERRDEATTSKLKDTSVVAQSEQSIKDQIYAFPQVLSALLPQFNATRSNKELAPGATVVKDVAMPKWKISTPTSVSKHSIASRTRHVLNSIATAESAASRWRRIEDLLTHIEQYPESRHYAIKEGAVAVLLRARTKTKDPQINGNIRTKAILDVETKSGYWLTIYAQDHGVVPLNSKLQMYVEVLDENDNTPLTEEPVYYPSVPENSPAGVNVLRIPAFDRDVTPQEFTYTITSGNPEGYFLINSTTGLITTSGRKLDRENQAEHVLEVTVKDDGRPPLASTTRVVVQVEDINDHSPEFEQKFYTVRIPASVDTDKPLFQKSRNRSRAYDLSIDTLLENGTWETFSPDSMSGDHCFRVLASDLDVGENGKIQYSIKGGRGKGKFKIHPTTGMVYSQRGFEAGQEYEMMIKAADNGEPQRSHQTRVSVQVVEAPKESENPPIFRINNQTAEVTESDEIGFLVALVQATDKDGDTLWYDIVEGDKRDEFFIGRDNGNVLLAKKLDWEAQNFYNLTIEVSDGSHMVRTQLFVNVIDINDHRPEFTESSYRVEISENVEKGETVLQLHATDEDEDKKVFYSLHAAQSQETLRIFHVDSVTGTITLNDYLDREAIEEHVLTVMVRDQGTPAKRNYARVIVTVHDHNDHTPEFISEIIQGKVYETSAIGTAIVQVYAIDRDRGDNARITYTITSGNVGNVFTIDKDLGYVRVARELDLGSTSEYILLVKATDHGTPPLSSTVPVHVMVTMADNAPPRFIEREMAAEIYENQQIGAYVKHVEARSTSSLQFELVRGNRDDAFFINPSTGVIVTKNPLDYEKLKFYNLTVSATNMAGSTALCNVIVHVLDRNDNAPRFLQALYSGEISEGVKNGSFVLTNSSKPLVIKAEDADSELNALLNYDIVEDLPRKYFHIDSSTGAIRTVMIPDHETVPTFVFHVKVSDLGKPKLSSETTAKVVITVTDVNDCPPKFLQNDYNTTLLLPTYKNVAVIRVSAVDPDTTEGTALRYDIIDGNKDVTFEIDSQTGFVTVLNPEQLKKHYLLHVRVSDGKYSSIAQINVNVEKSENSGLVFQETVYTGTIVENSTRITTVAVVNVLGSALNEHIVFRILNPTEMFVIGATSGAVRTTGIRFDREVSDNYELIVEAKSQTNEREKPRVAHVIVNVTILDINDNCPMFVNLPYYAVVSIEAQKGDVISKVHAIDMDSGDNGEVRYELKKGHGELFKVCRKTGEISLKQNLEGHNREYQLTIAAYDGGQTPCSIEVPVNVKVIDRSMPVFDKQFYTDSVLESMEVHSPLGLSIQAQSPLSRKLIYSITKGNDFEEFALDFNTAPDNNNGPCVIYVVDELDYEQKKQYELTVRATDSVSGVYAEVLVSILVLDVNDCPPEFTQDSYNISVSEAASFGTSILKVGSRDNDTGINQQVRYAIQNDTENSHELFHIDPEEGVIFLKRSLDHESHDSHHFTVLAMDRGVPSLSSTAHVWVSVVDMNDNPPKFEQPSYTCFLSEHAERGQFVTVVSASDPDYVDDKLTYTIVGGNDQQTYNIDQNTGIISLINMQNFGEQKLRMLNVSVTDGVYTSFTRVKIEILPANRHNPKFPNPLVEVTVMENQLPGRLVTSVLATDDDFGEYGTVLYSIPSTLMRETFDINRVTGEIVTKKKLNREARKLYEIPVMAADAGGRSGFVIVRVKVGDENDNPPVFLVREYKASIHSNLTINSPFMRVRAHDDDEDEAAKIEYSIFELPNSETNNLFGINPITGALFLTKSAVPWENQLFEFFIRATDRGLKPHRVEVPISVYIMSPQEVPPLFERKEVKFFMREASPVGNPITKVKTVTNTTVKYRLVSVDDDAPMFSIDTSGHITLARPLDREVKDNHLIAVLAETDSSPALTALAEISLQVLDENDHPPKFESNPYVTSVAENVEEGTTILKVTAHDEDLGSNGEVRYSFGTDIGELANVFTVDAYTGWLSTLVQLDKEKQSEYKFQIVATDNGNPKHFARTAVNVKLKDYNDNAPAFVEDRYVASVNEDALPGTVVVKLATVDRDTDLDTPVEFYITSGDSRSQFQVRSTGEVYVAKPLDRETIDRYELNVVGTDGKYVFDTKVSVEILDVNDNPPYCLRYRYREVLSEGSHPGTFVLTVLATDYDDEPNAKLRFYLTGDNNDKFSLDKDTGVLKTVGQLDRETHARYSLTAHVQDRDKPVWECSSQLEIFVSDLNDNAPKFTMNAYSATLPEDVEVGTLVTKVHATDDDIGINRKVRYEFIDSADGHFIIAADSGIVTLGKPLDRETKAMYNVTIQAIDQGSPQLASVAVLIVNVQDINDNPPEFTSKFYFARVPEIDAIGTEVARVLATSKDTGVNADVYYSIVGGNEHKKFQIDAQTGVIKIAEQLDYERARDYFLTIQAVDGGIPPLSNHASVNVTVTDCNDNAPIFNEVSYRAAIREDAKIGERVARVFANDLDSEENGVVTYHIERGDRLKQFFIDEKTGAISLAIGLDWETISSYVLEIHARDGGQPMLQSFVMLDIEILDANDNPPLFSQSNYTAVVQEDKPPGHAILKFAVTDADTVPNAEPYTFDFRSGNENDAFRLEQDGSLRTAMKFNSRVRDRYVLHIRVFDNGSPPLYSDAWVIVKVIEESQYPPVITPLEVIVNSYLDEYPGGTIGRVHASDRDQYDTLRFALVPTTPHPNVDLFKIEANDGSLVALPRLDVGEYRVNVSATDGKFTSYATIKVNVDLITEKMLANSVIVRFREVSPDDFILSHRKGFVRTVRNAMNCRLKDIVVISVQASSDDSVNLIKSRATRQVVHNDLDLLFAVRKSASSLGPTTGFHTSDSIREALNQHIEELEESTKLVVEEIVRHKCNKGYCVYGDCLDRIILDQATITPVSTDVMSFVSPRHRHKIECTCKEGYAGNHCEIVVNECATDPCPQFKVCVPDSSVQGYTCQCPEGFAGQICDIDISKCHDESCYIPRNPISFSGKSYARYRIDASKLRETIEDRLSLSLRVRTVQPTGNLMYAAGKIDYNVLEIVNGVAQYKFDLGSGEGLVRVSSVYVSDGQWHEIQLERESNSARLTVDGKHVAHGSAPGINDILNLQSDDLYLGAEVKQHPTILGFEDVQRGFHGCMDDVRIARVSVPLHMSGASSVAVLKLFANVAFSCDTATILVPPGVCGSQPCQNGGTCREINDDERQQQIYDCQCHGRFTGMTCEIDNDPCASSPCLYGGRCKVVPGGGGDFTCECIDASLTGKRCQFGRYCGTNPCTHGGICEEGNSGPICKCHGYSGDRCELDVNECESNPCANGATCVNEIGSYRCTCPPNTTGVNCANPVYSTPIISDPFNITWEQLVWIGVALVANLLLIIVFLCYRKIRLKRTRARANNINNETRKQIVLNSARPHEHEFKRSSKLSNLEVIQREPPQCPPRPASYTPSSNNEPANYGNAAAVALNNLDTLRSYGSAGDELENFPPDYLRNLNRSTPVPAGTLTIGNPVGGNATGSDTDSLHKPMWQEQMHLASFITDTAKIKNDLKRASPVVPELTTGGLLLNSTRRTPHGGGTSVASLSSIEDDPRIVGGYHWDCSDWVRPSQNPLPNITEVPGSEVPDSSSFHSNESNESNAHQLPAMHGPIDPTRDIETLNEDQESEYVGDSECGTEFSEHYHCPETQRLNPLDSGGEGEYKYKDSNSYLRHPNSYLPHYNIHTDTENEMNPLNGRLSTLQSDDEEEDEDEEEEEEDDVVPYGFPSTRRNRCHKGDDIDEIGSVITTLEERNSLLGGGTSNSDLSTNLCEIDDSEYEINEQKTNGRMWLSGSGITQTSV